MSYCSLILYDTLKVTSRSCANRCNNHSTITALVSTYLTPLTYVLLLSVKQMSQTTCLHPALSCVTTPICLQQYLKPDIHTSFSRSLFQAFFGHPLLPQKMTQQCQDFSIYFMQPLFSFIYSLKYGLSSSFTAAAILLCHLTSLDLHFISLSALYHLHFISSLLATDLSDWQIHAGDHTTAQELRAVWDGKPQVSDSRYRMTDAAPAHTSPEL